MTSIADYLAQKTDSLSNHLIWRFAPQRLAVTADRPIVSFTFDDVPDTALTEGAAILERHGARGTFYIAGGLANRIEPDRRLISQQGCRKLFASGHEIGCHTFSHHKIRTYGRQKLTVDLDRNLDFLAAVGIPHPPENFAFPYNAAWPAARKVFAKRFASARAGGEAINRGPTDPWMLKAVEIRQPDDHAVGLTGWIDDVAKKPGWLIFFTHDISSSPTPFGCRPETFEHLVSHAVQSGCDVLPVRDALARYGWVKGEI